VGAAAAADTFPMDSRLERFHAVLSQPTVNLDHLRALAWNGIPAQLRPTCWRLLLVRSPSRPVCRLVPLRPLHTHQYLLLSRTVGLTATPPISPSHPQLEVPIPGHLTRRLTDSSMLLRRDTRRPTASAARRCCATSARSTRGGCSSTTSFRTSWPRGTTRTW
jgi:hypothetical protein